MSGSSDNSDSKQPNAANKNNSNSVDQQTEAPRVHCISEDHDHYDDFAVDQERARKILLLWMFRAHRAASAHYHQSIKYRGRSTRWTIFNAIYSILLLFWVTRLSNDAGVSANAVWEAINNFITGIFGAFLVIIGVVQFILRYSERQGAHREAGQEFSNLQRKIERYSLYTRHNMAQIHNISREYNHITRSYPLVDHATWSDANRKKLIVQIQKLEDDLRDVACSDVEEWSPKKRFFFF